MTADTEKKRLQLQKILEQEFEPDNIVTLQEMVESISKVSNVRVRTKTVENYYELGIDNVDESGVLRIPKHPKKFAPANASAIESQRLHKGDLFFGYRGKMGRVGLVEEEFDVPVVTNNGMIRIRFAQERREETPRYVQTYLETPLIRSYLNAMLENRNGVKVLNVHTIEILPIPKFEEMAGITKFTTLIERRKSITLAVKKIVEQAEILLEKRKAFESEAISLQTHTLKELTAINQVDHRLQDTLQHMQDNLQMMANEQPSKSVLLRVFEG